MITLLRHGEVKGGKRFRGTTNDPLTPKGFQQMLNATEDPFMCDLVTSSPLMRCASFAEFFSQQKSVPLLIEPRLAELHFGDWEGRTSKEIYEQTPNALERFWQDPQKYPPPGSERLHDFQARVVTTFDELMKNHADQHILMVTHGGVIRILLCHLQHIPLSKILELQVSYGARTTFERQDNAKFVRVEQS